VQRAGIVLFSAERLLATGVAHRAEISRPAVWPWQLRFAEPGANGLLHDKTRRPFAPARPLDSEVRRTLDSAHQRPISDSVASAYYADRADFSGSLDFPLPAAAAGHSTFIFTVPRSA